MHKEIPINRLDRSDLLVYQGGLEECLPSHSYGPAVRDHFLIHYVKKGKGLFHVGGKVYEVSEHQGFLICPNIITYYEADGDDPWYYIWIGFNGPKAELYLRQAGLTSDTPVFNCDKDEYITWCFDEIVGTKNVKKGRELRLTGLLHLFLSKLIEESNSDFITRREQDLKEEYVRTAINFMEINYSRKISIMQLSQHIGLDRSYLGSIFKELIGTTPQQYLISLRINKACALMSNPELTIGDISRSVGYDDPLLFSKMFKKEKSIPPVLYRQKMADTETSK